MKSRKRQTLLNRSHAQTREIREAVFARARLGCEGCSLGFPSAMDHFFGRGKEPQSVANCWALCEACDREKTENLPSASSWLARFIAHCEKHGYVAEAEKAAAKLEVLKAKGRA